MSNIVLAKSGVDPEVTRLAQQIKDAQGPEMITMTGLLTAWNQPLIPDHGAEADEHIGTPRECEPLRRCMS